MAIGMTRPVEGPSARTEAFYASLAKQFETRQEPAAAAQRPMAVRRRRLPWLTWIITATLIAIFAAELSFGIAQPAGSSKASNWTLLAFGGALPSLVREGEWYRLLSTTLPHLNPLHLALNCISLLVAGHVLERRIGSVWFGAIYVLGALGGSLTSLMFGPETIAVGASGAVMAVCAALLVASFHYPGSDSRNTWMLFIALLILVPSLLPLSTTFLGAQVDHAAHIGGALTGAVLGFVVLRRWPRTEDTPRRGRAVTALAILGLVGFAYAALPLTIQYPVWEMTSNFVPGTDVPQSEEDIRARAADLAARYPRDPRARAMHASVLLDAGDKAGAERELRSALVEEERWLPLMPAEISPTVRAMLATILADGRLDEAKAIAQPACARSIEPDLRKMLDHAKLCPVP